MTNAIILSVPITDLNLTPEIIARAHLRLRRIVDKFANGYLSETPDGEMKHFAMASFAAGIAEALTEGMETASALRADGDQDAAIARATETARESIAMRRLAFELANAHGDAFNEGCPHCSEQTPKEPVILS